MTKEADLKTGGGGRWRSLFPPAQWLAGYQCRWLGPDLLAGFTLAAYAIPVSMACASLAGVPPQMGLYCCLAVCDLSNTAYVDMAGARMLTRLHDELKALSIGLRLVGAHASERDILRAERLDALCGPIQRADSVADVLAAFSNLSPVRAA